jgi:hypothetical protein
MTYALLQTSLNPPPLDTLGRPAARIQGGTGVFSFRSRRDVRGG